MIINDYSDLKQRIKKESERFRNDELESSDELKNYIELLVEFECALRSQLCKIQKEIDAVEKQVELKEE